MFFQRKSIYCRSGSLLTSVLHFQHIWCCVPGLRIWRITCAVVKNFCTSCVSAVVVPCTEALGLFWSNIRIKTQSLPGQIGTERSDNTLLIWNHMYIKCSIYYILLLIYFNKYLFNNFRSVIEIGIRSWKKQPAIHSCRTGHGRTVEI